MLFGFKKKREKEKMLYNAYGWSQMKKKTRAREEVYHEKKTKSVLSEEKEKPL